MNERASERRGVQFTHESGRMLVGLRQETQAKGGSRIVAPRPIQYSEQIAARVVEQVLEVGAHLVQLGRRQQDDVERLDHDARKLEVLLLLEDARECAKDLLGAEEETQVARDQRAAALEQRRIDAVELDQAVHQLEKVLFLG